MYIRESKTKNKKTGKVYIKHSLVESVRTKRGPRQRLVMTLGQLDIDKSLWKDLALALEIYLHGGHELQHLSLFELPQDLLDELNYQRSIIDNRNQFALKESSLDAKNKSVANGKICSKQASIHDDNGIRFNNLKNIQQIDVDSLKVTQSRSLGPELLANDAWNQLGFNELLADCGFSKREQALAAAVIWGRLIKPGSDLSTWRWLQNSTSLPDFFPINISRAHKDRIYEIADKLLLHKDYLENKLYSRQCELFSQETTVFLFDLTNFYFEGKCEGNNLAKRGKSKEKRNQNPLVSLALIVDSNGFPVRSHVHRGNIGEPTTLENILKSCGLLGTPKDGSLPFKPILAMDRGIATAKNIEFIKSEKFPFTVIERANVALEFKDEFKKMADFKKITDNKGQIIHLKKLPGTNKVLCASEAKAEKENAMYERKKKSAQKQLDGLIKAIDSGRLKDAKKINQKLGRIKGKCAGFDKIFTVEITDASVISYKINPPQDIFMHGCYVIEYDKIDASEEEIWRFYMTLTTVESAFRSMKTDLGTRPVYHQGAERTSAHLFLSILAYHMLRNIECRISEKGDGMRWQSIREILETHQRQLVTWRDEKDKVWFKKTSARPEPNHVNIYRKLKVVDFLEDYIYPANEGMRSAENVVPKK